MGDDLDDFEIDRTAKTAESDEPTLVGEPEAPERRPQPPWGLIVTAAAMLAAAGLGAFYLWPRRPPAPVPSARPETPLPPTDAPSQPSVDLPPLAESDAFVRDLAKALSGHPQLAAWLAQRGLVRTLTVAIQNVAEGRSPAPFLAFLTPRPRFQAVQTKGRMVADPESHAAYDDVADAVASLSTTETVRVFSLVRPLFEAAYSELGYPAGDFSKAVTRALAVIAATPVPEREIELRTGRVFLEYADPKLEALPLAQKQLLRMGPRNLRLFKAKAAELSAALEAVPRPASP